MKLMKIIRTSSCTNKLQKQPTRCVLIKTCYIMWKYALQSHFIEITLWHESSPVNFLYIFRTLFPKNTSGGLPLELFVLSLTFHWNLIFCYICESDFPATESFNILHYSIVLKVYNCSDLYLSLNWYIPK